MNKKVLSFILFLMMLFFYVPQLLADDEQLQSIAQEENLIDNESSIETIGPIENEPHQNASDNKSISRSDGEESENNIVIQGEDERAIGNIKLPGVSSTGAFQASVPIDIPIGRKGLAPDLTLRYSSSHKNGWVGTGWDLSFGVIQRSTKNGLDYSSNKFDLIENGSASELVAKPVEWGGNYYGRKIESNYSKFQYINDEAGWIVKTRDGKKLYFGSSQESRHQNRRGSAVYVLAWYLDRIEDANGNTIKINYSNPGDETIYPESIQYTSFKGNNPTYTIEFETEDRSDIVNSFGDRLTLINTTKRLKAIKIFQLNPYVLLRTYVLSYEDESVAREKLDKYISRLTSVQAIGTSQKLPKTTISWQTKDALLSGSFKWADDNHNNGSPSGNGIAFGKDNFFADLNGDGQIEWIEYRNGGFYIRSGSSDIKPTVPNLDVNNPAACDGLLFTDLNGDGKSDLLFYQRYYEPGIHAKIAPTYQDRIIIPTHYPYWISKVIPTDINGDGKADLVVYEKEDKGNTICTLYITQDDGSVTSAGEMNGRFLWPNFNSFADVNGDGFADAVFHKIGGSDISIYWGRGDGSFDWGHGRSTGGIGKPYLADVNNDGLVDLLSVYSDVDKDWGKNEYFLKVRYGKGDGFFTSSKFSPQIRSSGVNFYKNFAACVDLGKDGTPDLIFRNGAIKYGKRVNSNVDAVKTMENGHGGSVTVGYEINSSMPFLLPVVKKVTVNPGLSGDLITNQYEYSDGVYDRENREFRGFTHVGNKRSDGSGFHTNYYADKFRKGIVSSVIGQKQYVPGNPYAPGAEESDSFMEANYNWLPENPDSVSAEWAAVALQTESVTRYDGCSESYKDTIYGYKPENGLLVSKTVSGSGNHEKSEKIVSTYEYQEIGSHDDWHWRLNKHTIGTESLKPSEPIESESVDPNENFFSFLKRFIKNKADLANKSNHARAPGGLVIIARQTIYSDFDNFGNFGTETKVIDVGAGSGLSTRYTYDAYGNILTTTDYRGNTTSVEYDSLSNTYPYKIISPQTGLTNHVVQNLDYDYNAGKPQTVIDENNRTTTYQYDEFGRFKKAFFADGGWIENEYYDFSFPVSAVTKKGYNHSGNTINKTVLTDGLGRTIQEISKGEKSFLATRVYYDNMGRVVTTLGPFETHSEEFVEIPSGVTHRKDVVYDFYNNPTKIIENDSKHGSLITNFSYCGNSTTILDPDGKERIIEKDFLGRIFKSSDGELEVYYDYNAAGDLILVNRKADIGDGMFRSAITRMEYDTVGRLEKKQDPDLGSWTYWYEANGDTSQIDANGQEILVKYDELNRPIKKIYTNFKESNPDVTWIYDEKNQPNGIGRLTTTIKGSVTDRFGYDSMGRVTVQTRNIDDGPLFTTRTAYDLAGRVDSIIYPGTGNYKATYTYHPGTDLVAGVSTNDMSSALSNYMPDGKIGRISHENGVTTNYEYDPESFRLNSIKTDSPGKVLQNLTYTYYPSGDVESIDNRVTDVKYSYIYDNRHQMTEEKAEGNIPDNNGQIEIFYNYDPRPDPHSAPNKFRSKNARSGSADPFHAVKTQTVLRDGYEVGYLEYLYDDNGNMITGYDYSNPGNPPTEKTYIYNSDNMPTSISGGVSLDYDGNNARAIKTVGSEKIYYVGNLYEERFTKPTRYIFAGNLRIASSSPGDGASYYHKDHLGSTTAMTDAAGNTVSESVGYHAYGLEWSPASGRDMIHTFTDQEKDGEAGLMNYNARLYDPVLGMFLSPDTATQNWYDPLSLNRYSYCRNNPIKYVDPTGHLFGIDDFAISFYQNYISESSTAGLWQGTADNFNSSWSTVRDSGIFGMGPLGNGVLGTRDLLYGGLTGDSATMVRGADQIDAGMNMFFKETATDIRGAVQGQLSHLYTFPRDVSNIWTKASNGDGWGAIEATSDTIQNLGILRYGNAGGAGYGIDLLGNHLWGTQYNNPLNGTDAVNFKHDREYKHLNWVAEQYTYSGNQYTATGPLGIAYKILGTVPFTIAGLIQNMRE